MTTTLLAGPPLVCQRIEIGNARSLPWGNANGWANQDPAYPLERLTVDTLALLTTSTPMNVRMETLRRAAIYSAADPRLAEELALRLSARVLDGDGKEAMAWFDAGYFVETVRQAAAVYQYDMLSPAQKAKWKVHKGIPGLDGKKWVARAAQLGGKGAAEALAKMGD